MRRYYLYTTAPPSSSNSLQQIRQPNQVLVTKEGSPGGDLYERIDPSYIRTTRHKGLQVTFIVTEKHAILTPRLVIIDQLELATGQGMKGMRHPKMFGRSALMRCI